MKQIINLFKSWRGFAVALVLGAMVNAETTQANGWVGKSGNLVQQLERDGRFTTLLAALEIAGLKDTVANGGVFTVFAPTDAAFAALPAGTVQSLVTNIPALQKILTYHVLAGRKTVVELVTKSTVNTLQGNPILALSEGLTARINGQKVTFPSLPASNGIIHPIQGVLIPPATDITINSLVDVLSLDGRFTTLIAAVQAAGLADALTTGGPFTLFAPTDEAFAALPPGTVESLITNVPALQNILLYHVLGEKVPALKLLGRQTAETLQGDTVSTSVKGFGVFVNQSRVINPNVNAPNGIIHVIDALLLPPPPKPNLLELLRGQGKYNTLVTALEVAGLDTVVASNGPFTIFAPTDEAFAKVPAGALAALLADKEALTAVLLYHVVSGDKSAIELLQQRKIATLQGDDVRAYLWRGSVYVNKSKVLDANLSATNGRVHGINAVLFPPAQ